MNLRNKNGSITIFVLIALLFMASFLIIMFASNVNKSKIVKEQIDIIKDIYGKNTGNEAVNDIYNRVTDVSTIIINKFENTNNVIDNIIKSNGIEDDDIQEYKIGDQTFTSKENLCQYIKNNNIYDVEKELTIKDTNGVEINETVKFEKTNSVINIEIESNGETENITVEYKIEDQICYSQEELYQYIEDNNIYDVEKELTITVKNEDTGYSKEITETVKFVKPKIETITTPIITNITPVQSSYVTYDEVDKKEETYTILDLNNETYSTMTEVVARANQWLFENKQYEVETPIKVVAKGNNNLISESTQPIKFIRGVKVTNEAELTTALASTSPSYIQLANDIACSNTISVDGVTHKLDLNNYTVSKTVVNESFTFITLGSNSNLTIMDSSNEKQGTLVAKLSEPNYDTGSSDARLNTIYTINNQGTLNIESGIVASDLVQKVGEPNKNIHVKDLAKTIKNTGTLNLNGGAITSNAITQGASHAATRNGEATAIGIENTGTVNLNSGSITCYAEANMVMTLGIWGETRAYAYGVTNSGGTVNRNNNVTISVTAIANDEGSYKETKDSAEIKEVK